LYQVDDITIRPTDAQACGQNVDREENVVNSVVHKTDPGSISGWINGLLGVVIFSGSLPATRVAVLSMDPFFLTFLRASIAGILAVMLIFGFREKRLHASQLIPLIVVS
jgi:hypothetical protein